MGTGVNRRLKLLSSLQKLVVKVQEQQNRNPCQQPPSGLKQQATHALELSAVAAFERGGSAAK